MNLLVLKKLIGLRVVKLVVLTTLTVCLGMAPVANTVAEHDQSKNLHKKYMNGESTFQKYCSRCHGRNADGRGPKAPLFIKLKTPRPSNFKIKFYTIRPAEYLESVIRDGGAAHSLSKSMPPFGGELSKKQIENVVHFIKSVSYHANEKK